MSEQIKPFDALRQIAGAQQQQDELVEATKQALGATQRAYNQWVYHLEELSRLTAAHGLDNLLAVAGRLDANAPTLMQGVLTAAQTFHESVTDEPFPTMHAEPVPPEVAPEGEPA